MPVEPMSAEATAAGWGTVSGFFSGIFSNAATPSAAAAAASASTVADTPDDSISERARGSSVIAGAPLATGEEDMLMYSMHEMLPADRMYQSLPPAYEAEADDLLDQHVAYYLRHHPEAHARHSIVRGGPGEYYLDGRVIQVEWQYSTEPGGQGCLVAVDGPLRQPFADYMEMNESNVVYDTVDIGHRSNLQSIPRHKRLSFHDQKPYSRLEAMKVAKEQALVRERAADYVLDGREVPGDLMSKYKKNIHQKLGHATQVQAPGRPRSPVRQAGARCARAPAAMSPAAVRPSAVVVVPRTTAAGACLVDGPRTGSSVTVRMAVTPPSRSPAATAYTRYVSAPASPPPSSRVPQAACALRAAPAKAMPVVLSPVTNGGCAPAPVLSRPSGSHPAVAVAGKPQATPVALPPAANGGYAPVMLRPSGSHPGVVAPGQPQVSYLI
eukprot:NODE_4751_length_1852_cov_3.816232.p1 GENE.NODE_4751_length_1852_cov_3.816232~~NODE_4751_length_1852_cov_3.816232.p1  ORF type:complete len:440 (+),score=118.47 NODE_4751_length_1852_cov_3.816232:103-1422(+)